MEAQRQTLTANPYSFETLSKLLKITLWGNPKKSSEKLLGRDGAKNALQKALSAAQRSDRWHVITTVGIPGSGKTHFLRKGILNDYYKGQSLMVTYTKVVVSSTMVPVRFLWLLHGSLFMEIVHARTM